MEEHKHAKVGQVDAWREYDEDFENELFGYEGTGGPPRQLGKEDPPSLKGTVLTDENVGKEK